MGVQLQFLKMPDTLLSKQGETVSLNESGTTIGRADSCDVVLGCKERSISRQHAKIIKSPQDNSYLILDTSANGTNINNQISLRHGDSQHLKHGDTIHIGDYTLKLCIQNKLKERERSQSLETTKSYVNNEVAKPSLSKQRSNPSSAPQKPFLGHTNESFTPPNAVIPKNWNLDVNKKKASNKPKEAHKTLNFNNQETLLLKALLKGLGIPKENGKQTLSPEKMVTLGRCLRASMNSMIKQKQHVENIKENLCVDKKYLMSDLNYSSLANIDSINDFISLLFSPDRETHAEIPLEIIKCHKEIMEDQAVIYKSFNNALDILRDELSPFSIETRYKKNESSNLVDKLVPSSGKWELYKKHWGEKCISLKQLVKRSFANNIKTLHKNRINQRQIIRRKE